MTTDPLLAQKCEPIMTYMTLAAFMLLCLSPVLLPLVVTVAHAIGNWRPKPRAFGPVITPERDAVVRCPIENLGDLLHNSNIHINGGAPAVRPHADGQPNRFAEHHARASTFGEFFTS